MAGSTYGALALEHYRHPHNVGSLDATDDEVGSALVGSPALGEVIKLQFRVQAGTIVAARFKAFGSVSTIAIGSWLTQRLQGCLLEDTQAIHSHDIVSALALPAVKMHSALLAEDALRAAVANYTEKHLQPHHISE
ncbi:MAG TPA: iron-sulfur cluster assembly scaffold protein [Castellaniella sp.]|uniref:iron-sulfur cluster assembly scaffold protein n=1 Tax=Castellaniella sp. TaxID=1955812 RepID=UPI002EED6B66